MVGLLGLVVSRREISTYTGQHSTERKDKQPCLELDSNARSHCPKIKAHALHYVVNGSCCLFVCFSKPLRATELSLSD
jgi:hypothetical protein